LKKIIALVLLALVGLVVYTAAAFHFIQTDEKLHRVGKEKMGFNHIYTDTRGWGVTDWAQNGVIRDALARAKSQEIGEEIHQGVDSFKDAVNGEQ
jgi:hypothetical protein